MLFSAMNFHPTTATSLNCEPQSSEMLDLTPSSPANGEFTVELATNRAFTTLSYNGRNTARFGDGDDHDEFDRLAKQELGRVVHSGDLHAIDPPFLPFLSQLPLPLPFLLEKSQTESAIHEFF